MISVVVVGTGDVAARIRGSSQQVREALSQAVQREWFALQAYVVKNKLSGQVLKRVTGNLASSINVGGKDTATRFEDGGSGDIIGAVGTKVVYGAVHEYGGTVTVKAHTRRVTVVYGRPVTPTTANVRSYNYRLPERSFLRSSLDDRADQIRTNIAAYVKDFMNSAR
jgi:phage gpG-like protein